MAGLAGLTWLVRAVTEIPRSIGAPESALRRVVARARNHADGLLHNTEPSSEFVGDPSSVLKGMATRGRTGQPAGRVPLATPLAPVAAAELAATWYGHASVLVEIDGCRVLADPVWGDRVSPSSKVGPKRMHPVPAPIDTLPKVDAIVISHDHYDHLDLPTVEALLEKQTAPFLVPLGIGEHLRFWGVPEERIIELDWDESATVAGLTITCTETRHFSGRGLKRNTTLWASWVVTGRQRRVFFGGDSGYGKCFAEIGSTYGPFDLTMLPIGAYNEMWPDIHMNPEEAVRAHTDLNGGDSAHGILLPIHWATFNLALHAWSEPVTRLIDAAAAAGVQIQIPKPGQRLDLTHPSTGEQWWAGL